MTWAVREGCLCLLLVFFSSLAILSTHFVILICSHLPIPLHLEMGDVGREGKTIKPKAQVFGSPDNYFCLITVEAVLWRGLDVFKLMTRKLRPINCNNTRHLLLFIMLSGYNQELPQPNIIVSSAFVSNPPEASYNRTVIGTTAALGRKQNVLQSYTYQPKGILKVKKLFSL